MDHNRAVQTHAATRYLLGRLSDGEAAAFEEHFFTCFECAEEVRADEVFALNLRAVLNEAPRVVAVPSFWSRISMEIQAILVDSRITVPLAAVACVLLAIVTYQNVVVPQYSEQAELAQSVSALPVVALKIARSDERFVIPKGSQAWLAYFLLSKPNAAPSYRCDILRADGKLVVARTFGRPKAGQPVYLFLPSSLFPDGSYRFRVKGANSDPVLAEYEVDLFHE